MRPLLLSLLLLTQALLAAERPNFVFVYTDDQRWDAMSVIQKEQGERARFPWLSTPNMDRLAREGLLFTNAFVTMSLCAPSRAAFLTGRYNHLNGVSDNHTAFPLDSATYPSLLRAAGYKTAYIGKWHMGSQRERPGFDFAASFIGQGRYFDCPLVVNGVDTPTKGWVDDVTTDYALKFIRENKASPFALILGFKTCHGPFDPPERARSRFEGEWVRPPINATPRAIYLSAPQGGPAPKKKGGEAGKENTALQQMRCLSAADENLGRVLDALDELGLAKNTVVVFTSDNGYYLGEHGLGDKRTAYDESMRIPMIVRWPGHFAAGRALGQMMLNIDIAPTFLELAGLPAPTAMQGRSWAPLVMGKKSDWRTAFFYEYFQERGFGAPTVFALRTDSAKLVKYPGHDEWTELFDLKADPYERKNLAKDPTHEELLARMQQEYDRQAKLADFRVPKAAAEDAAAARPIIRAKERVLDLDWSKGSPAGPGVAIPLADGRNGAKAARFDGKTRIEIPKSPKLDPSRGPWTVEATVLAENPEGVIVARGGKSQGYSLYLHQGRPAFTVAINNKAITVSGKEAIVGKWTDLAGVITADQRAVLNVNGQVAAAAKLPGFIASDPHDGMQIGDDTGSQVTTYEAGSNFTGLIESVRLVSGEK